MIDQSTRPDQAAIESALIAAVTTPECAKAAQTLRGANPYDIFHAACRLAQVRREVRILEVAARELARDAWRGGKALEYIVGLRCPESAEFVEAFAACPTIKLSRRRKLLERAAQLGDDELAGRSRLALAGLFNKHTRGKT